jgi:type IV pilus biogenesis protein CpaD/CtpE
MKTPLAISLVVLACAGCFNRAHMTEHYGRAYRQAFDRQVVNPSGVAANKYPKGLDALEASIVVETYRTQLAPKGGGTAQDQMILLSPQATNGGLALPSTVPMSK